MKFRQISLVQTIVNKCNSKKDFKFRLKKDTGANYIVSIKNIINTKNPSLVHDLNIKIDNLINEYIFDSVGMWLDKDTNLYNIDANLHFNSLDAAIRTGKRHSQKAIWDIKNNKVINIK